MRFAFFYAFVVVSDGETATKTLTESCKSKNAHTCCHTKFLKQLSNII